ncbi:hypothetical protein CYMTET_24470 [Cymbomonas tetramitiformis]|uniref:Uncharacterized protein n=1 Tax=Cymbomonas tetramitiformis TaxID=36881 RepID=A0AAE0FW89_9CHLO|nr:hypothetical protein CYMTET_24470 [Cymbomonas tetramitiformis]
MAGAACAPAEAPPARDLHSPDSPEFPAFRDDVPRTTDVRRPERLGGLDRVDEAHLAAAHSLAPFNDEDEWTFPADRRGPIGKPPHLRWEPDVTIGTIDPPPGDIAVSFSVSIPAPSCYLIK